MNKVMLAIVIPVLLIGGGIWATHKKADNSAQTTPSVSNVQNSNPTTSTEHSATAQNTITYDGSSFSPASLTVKSGTTITIKNSSAQSLQLDSDPHPVHTDDTDLNVGVVNAGSSKTFVVTKTGSFGYHNHLDPSQTGKITIQ